MIPVAIPISEEGPVPLGFFVSLRIGRRSRLRPGEQLGRLSGFRHLGVLSYRASAGTSNHVESALVWLLGEGHVRPDRFRRRLSRLARRAAGGMNAMHRSMFGIKRAVTASAVALVVGAGLLAMTSAAAASPRATAGPRAAATAATAMSGDWEGSYTCGQGLTGLDLTIQSSGTTNALKAVSTFYPLPGTHAPVGVYDMTGTYHSASRIVLNFSRWIHQPPGYVPVGLVGALSGGKFSGTVTGCSTFSVQKQTDHPARSVVTGTWKGSYLGCLQGPTALTLIVKPAGQTGNQLAAKFEFHALRSNPGVPSGSYTMKGYLFPGVVVLYGSKWIKEPGGYVMEDLAGPLPKAGKFSGAVSFCSTFSLKRT